MGGFLLIGIITGYKSVLEDVKKLFKKIQELFESQDSLLKKVQDNNDWEERKRAFNKLNTESLKIIATTSEQDKAMEIAAKIILNQTNWSKEFLDTSSERLDWVIGAAALVEKPKPTSASIVNACHTYIKRGEHSRIPELRNLLLRYGDKPLAEDYLNCGNNKLYDAGSEWCRKNGYNVKAGYGSHRVRWGEAKNFGTS